MVKEEPLNGGTGKCCIHIGLVAMQKANVLRLGRPIKREFARDPFEVTLAAKPTRGYLEPWPSKGICLTEILGGCILGPAICGSLIALWEYNSGCPCAHITGQVLKCQFLHNSECVLQIFQKKNHGVRPTLRALT